MKQKILRITTVSISLNSLLKGQLRYLNQDFEVIGVAAGKEALDEVSRREGIRTVEVDIAREISLGKDLKALLVLICLIRKERPLIVHANTPKGSLLGMVAAWICRVPHRIYTVTGLRFETATGRFRTLLIAMERITCACATEVIPEGDGVRDTLRRNKVTKKPLRKVLNGNINGVDLNYFDRTPTVMQEALKLKEIGCFTFCAVGRMVKDKGINELVTAFVKLYALHPSVRLMLVGNFEEQLDPLDKETHQLILNHSGIRFMGYQADIRPFLAASDALAFASYREGFPNVVLQAGAMGLPAIVTDINGCNEIIEHGVNGEIIPPRDTNALYEVMHRWVIADSTVLTEMASRTRTLIASRYEQQAVWQAMRARYEGLSIK